MAMSGGLPSSRREGPRWRAFASGARLACRHRCVLAGWVASLVYLVPVGDAAGSVVSRLGEVFVYDPLTFDSGALQRGGWVRAGAGTRGGGLDVGVETLFFRDFSARVGYLQQFIPGEDNGLNLTWRFRFPVIESARFRHFTSPQFYYQGQHFFQAVDEAMPSHEFGGAEVLGFPLLGAATSLHAQLGVAFRPERPPVDGTAVPRAGGTARFAWLFQLYRPPPGRGGLWTVTFSVVEATRVWFGLPGHPGAAGRLTLTAGAPAVHFSPRGTCYTLGIAPRLTWSRGEGGTRVDWAGMASLAVSYRRGLE